MPHAAIQVWHSIKMSYPAACSTGDLYLGKLETEEIPCPYYEKYLIPKQTLGRGKPDVKQVKEDSIYCGSFFLSSQVTHVLAPGGQ